MAMHNNGMQAGRLADFSSDSESDSDSDNSTSSSNFFNHPNINNINNSNNNNNSNNINIHHSTSNNNNGNGTTTTLLSTSASNSSLNSMMLSSHLHNTLKRSSISPRSSLTITTNGINGMNGLGGSGSTLSELFANSKLMDGQTTPTNQSSSSLVGSPLNRTRKGSGSNLYENGGGSLNNSSNGVGTPPTNLSDSNSKVPALSRSSSSFLNMLTLRRKSLSVSGSSPLVPSTPLSQSTSSTPPPQTPNYKSFQSIFEALLDDLDYSKKRREELVNLVTEDKWSFLQRLKPDCVNSLLSNGILNQTQPTTTELKSLLSSPPKITTSQTQSPKSLPPPSLTRIPKSPRGYSKVLSNHSLFSYEDICRLRQQLIDKPVTWVVNFAESSGIVAILSMISSFSLREPKVEEDYLVINECLSCLKLLIELEMQSILLCDMTDIIFPHVTSSSLSVKKLTLEVLDVLCRTFTIGSTIVLESIKTYSKKHQVPLQTPLGFIHSPLDGEYTLDVKVNCMSLINQLIKGCKELSTRVDIRNEILSIGIQKSIKNLRIDGDGIETSSWKSLEREMQAFERMMVEDDNYIVPSLSPRLDGTGGGGSDIGFSLPSSPNFTGADPFDPIFDSRLVVKIACNPSTFNSNNESGTPTMVTGGQLDQSTTSVNSDDNPLASSSATATTANNNNNNVTMREVLVPISKKSQAGDVIRAIISSNSNLREFGEWGLYVCDGDSKTQSLDGRFLRDDEYILEQNASQPNGSNAPLRSLILFKQYTLKMVPWKVRMSLEKVKDMDSAISTKSNHFIEEPMDPTTTCAGLVHHIVKKHLPAIGRYCLESDDFGLYLDSAGFGTGGYWLEPLEKLHDYEIFKDPKSTVQLKLRQKMVKLKFADGTYEQLRLDLTSPTEKIFAEISEKVMDPSNMHNLHYYGIFIDRQDTLNQDHLVSGTMNTSSSGGRFNKKPTVEWIESGVPLYHYRINSRVCLRYAVRPSTITLHIDCSLFQQQKEQRQIKEEDELNASGNGHGMPTTTIMDVDDADDEGDSTSDSEDSIERTPICENLEDKLKSVATISSVQDNGLVMSHQDSPLLVSTSADVVSLMAIPAPVKPKQVVVQIPLHLPLNESLETEDNWLDCFIDQSKCRFHIDTFDGPTVNRQQPLNSQNFTSKNSLYIVLADEVELQNSEFQNHVMTNIWEEPNDRSTIIYDESPSHHAPASSRDTSISTTTTTATIASTIPPTAQSQIIRAATLNKLVELSTNNIDVDRESMNILLMTYQSFTTSDGLLDKLIERYTVPEGEEKQKKVIQLHVIVFVKNWLEQQSPQAASGGGLEERFLERINSFIDRLNADGYSNMVPNLKKLYDSAIKGKRAYAMPEVHRAALATKIPSLANSFLDDELFIAQQLTVREYETFKRIQIVEFLNQAWNKPKLQYKAPNLLKMIDRFNKVSMAVSTAILHQNKLKPRIKLICRFIKIAQHLRELNNFHLLTAFLAGIRNSSVLRLRVSWAKVPKKHKQTLEDLEKIMSMEGSFKAFRTIIKDIVPPCIPYLGVYLKDLTFIEDGNADSIEGLINWGKKKLMHNIISIIQKCQQIPYDFPLCTQQQQKSEMVLATFDSLPIADDEVLYQVSQQLEPKAIQQ
ncbi:Ras guanine nucleotide exchange factor [Cavenderia fasciculata]|uniref:Ras guanine nucleotide exchange factor n=1 Tax=Cavenderia fasciculata TaxID=261658 RepID=F4QFV3_CACFS|nr:Ras guanine nucleotide exchange factor [Cavenderia fasciculata]EGG14350.1 Ras guanine nucleotide exchange factor [Cavenderia fasciculata]|eukprot:XP_004351064.1 Ras guanine nucleotide exchange factor [Cavenderia fasciculata]